MGRYWRHQPPRPWQHFLANGAPVQNNTPCTEGKAPSQSTERISRAVSRRIFGLAEDEPFNQTVFCELLEDVGFQVDIAADGCQA